MQRFVIFANGMSTPDTMGGNSKITLEIVRNCPPDLPCLVFTSKPETFALHGVTDREGLQIVSIPRFPLNDMRNHIRMCFHYSKAMKVAAAEHSLGPDDAVFCVTDFFIDVIPAFILQKKHRFTWIPSFFLFIPFITENLRKRYHFPTFKYVIYYYYQRVARWLMLQRCSGLVITNSIDKRYFPKRLHDKILPIYGGVNTEQIPTTTKPSKIYDAIFCSRLHPQKGIGGLLDIWATVIKTMPSAKLAIIGNGEPRYETYLRKKADRINLNNNVEWLGYVNNTEKYELYQQSKMLVHATVYDNNGMVAAEALCTGLPVIMYDLPALRHVYSEGCLKIQEGRPDLYAEAIVKLLKDESQLTSILPTAPQITSLRQKWDWRHRTKIFVNFLKQF